MPSYSVLGFDTVFPGSQITGTEDPSYPVLNALDYRDNTEFAPNGTGSQQFVFQQGSIGKISYFAFHSKNAEDANLTISVEIFDMDINEYVQVATITNNKNNKPRLAYFGDMKDQGYFESIRQRITITSTNKPYITSMHCGHAIMFPYTPSLGFQPGHVGLMDEVESFKTEGNNFIQGRTISRGRQARGSINYVSFDLVDDRWEAFQRHVLSSKPLYWMWNSDRPTQIVYGLQNPNNVSRPAYVTSFHANIDIEINGYA